MNAKLPKVTLPSFDGKIVEWTAFWEQFAAHVDDAEDLAEVTKFGYLKSLLKGEAVDCISGLTLTTANYAVAVDLLKKRFGQKERIVFAHLQALLETPILSQRRAAKDLWRLSDGLQKNVRCLESLGVTGDQYGIVLTPLILSRLPEDLRMEWAREGLGKEGDLGWLLDFLRQEVERKERSEAFVGTKDAKAAAPVPHKEEERRRVRPVAAALHSSDGRRPCAVCGMENHDVTKCRRLTGSLEDRRRKVRDAGICFACLSGDHFVYNCNRRCRVCNGRHHPLLCDRPKEPSPRNPAPHPPVPVGGAPETTPAADPVIAAPSTAVALKVRIAADRSCDAARPRRSPCEGDGIAGQRR